MTTDIHSIWLMPNEADGARLAAIVTDLSRRFGTPLFTPHLTLRGDSDEPLAVLEAGIAQTAAEVGAFAETIAAIETSEAYFRSFYARFPVGRALAALKRQLDAEAADTFMPHVSLLYGAVAVEPKAAAVEEVGRAMVGQAIAFDRLCVVTSGQNVPIADWRVVATVWLK